MHRTAKRISLALIATTLFLGACKKEEAETPATNNPGGGNTNNNSPSNSAPHFSGANGVLWAINTISSQTIAGTTIDIDAGFGSAMFPTAANASTFVSAGTVSLNSTNLSIQPNNAYINAPDAANPTGIDFSSGTTHWVVSGANGIPAIDYTPSFAFPTVGAITSSSTVTKSSGYTLSVASVTPCDSVIFMVGSVVRNKPSGTTSCTFTASELGGLSTGASLVQVSAYKYGQQTYSGGSYYFGKQTARSKSATIQ